MIAAIFHEEYIIPARENQLYCMITGGISLFLNVVFFGMLTFGSKQLKRKWGLRPLVVFAFYTSHVYMVILVGVFYYKIMIFVYAILAAMFFTMIFHVWARDSERKFAWAKILGTFTILIIIISVALLLQFGP